jgi:hypothetical protein
MRNRRQTIASLRRLANRPGTIEEGKTAQRLLDRMAANTPQPKPFNSAAFPRGSKVYYNYWAYPFNDPCMIVGKEAKTYNGQIWLRMSFTHLKHPRRVPVTSAKGCHISTAPLSPAECQYMQTLLREDEQ